MERKYELLKDDTIDADGRTLYRIRALKDFDDVKKGDLGGYVESEYNLSQLGNCWLYDGVKTFGYARATGDTKIVCADNPPETEDTVLEDTTIFKVYSLRVENIRTYNNRERGYEDNKKYVLNCTTNDDTKYEISLWTEYGDCPSGWTGASWAYMTVKKVDNFIGVTHLPLRQLQFSLPSSLQQYDSMVDEDISNEVFSITENGDGWYPYGECEVNMDLFKETPRAKGKRPVWIFKGASGLGKSYLAGIIGRVKECDSIYETDSSEILENIEHADIIVIGNKYNHTVEDVLSHIQGEIEPILVDFTAIK